MKKRFVRVVKGVTMSSWKKKRIVRAKTERHAKHFGNIVAEQMLIAWESYCAFTTSKE